MKRNALVLLSVFLCLSFSSTAFATIPFEGAGECDGWTFSGTLAFGTLVDYYDVDFTVDLFQGGDLVYTYYEETTIHIDNQDFTFSGRWGMEICGDYTMVVSFTVFGPWGTFTEHFTKTFICDCTTEGCMYVPGFWLNHQYVWPADDLTIGCVDYTKAELLDILTWSTEGDLTIQLFHHLLAAKLNILNGADNYILGAIVAGDDFLCVHPLGSFPIGNTKDDCVAIKDELHDYNKIPCYSDTPDIMFSLEGDGSTTTDNAASATEETSWGSIKKKHQ